MTIPTDFYEKFRLNTSFLAAGTGLLMGYFSSIFFPFINPFAVAFVGGVIAVMANQWLVYGYFNGKMRGAFEYVYRESILDSSINSAIARARPGLGEVVLELESSALFKALITQASSQTEDGRFMCYMAAAKAANAGSEDRNTIAALKLAVELRPKDVVANYKLARAYERIGSAKEAIEAYEAALLDPSIDTDELKGFIAAQAQRVLKNGPQQAPPLPGLIYQLM